MTETAMNGKVLWNVQGGETFQQRKQDSYCHAVHRFLINAAAISCAVFLIVAIVAPVCAQSYPNKPIRFIVPFAPGGANDILGRIVAPQLEANIGQPVVVENRPGGGGHYGLGLIGKAVPDGYTIGISGPEISTGIAVFKKLNYDPVKDFVPVTIVAEASFILVTRPGLQVNNLMELVAYCKANPGKLNVANSGIGGTAQLILEYFKKLADINFLQVPYKGAGPSVVAMLGGEIDMTVLAPSAAVPQVAAGKLKALAVLGKERLPGLPGVPTSKEAGMEKFLASVWWGVFAPGGTPPNIVNTLNAAWVKNVKNPDVIKSVRKVGVEPVSSTTEQFSNLVKSEIALWSKVVQDANIPKIDLE